MAEQPPVHRYSHLPGANDQIDWLGSIHMLGTLAERPPANSGQFPSGTDGTVTNGATGFSASSANFISDMTGMNLSIFDDSDPSVTVQHFCTVTDVVSSTQLSFEETGYLSNTRNTTGPTASGPTYTGTSQTNGAGWQLSVGNPKNQTGSDGVVTSGSNVFTAASGNFTSSWVGCTISVVKGATSWADYNANKLEPRIVGVSGPTELTLSSAWLGSDATGAGWETGEWYWQPNQGTMFFATDATGSTASAGGLFVSDGTQWHQVSQLSTASGSGGYQFNSGTYGADNVGDFSLIEYTGTSTDFFSGTTGSAAPANLTSENEVSLAITTTAGMLLTASHDTDWNTGNAVLTIQQYNLTGDFGAFTMQIYAKDTSTGGTQAVTTIDATAEGNTTSLVECLIGSATNSGSGNAIGVEGLGYNRAGGATGTEIGGLFQVGGGQTGSRSLAIWCTNTTGSTTFAVRREGTLLAPLLPTSSTGLPSGAIWNNGGVLNVV